MSRKEEDTTKTKVETKEQKTSEPQSKHATTGTFSGIVGSAKDSVFGAGNYVGGTFVSAKDTIVEVLEITKDKISDVVDYGIDSLKS